MSNPFDQFDAPTSAPAATAAAAPATASASNPAPTAAAANPFDQFDDKPAAAGPVPFEDGKGGTLPDGSSTRDPAVWERWTKDSQAPAAAPAAAAPVAPQGEYGFAPAGPNDPPPGGVREAPVPAPDPRGGVGRNIAAGVLEGVGDVGNILSDPFGNLVGKPAVLAGVTLHDIFAPMFGGERFTPEQRADLLGANDPPQPGTAAVSAVGRAMNAPDPSTVVPDGFGQQVLRSAARGAAAGGVLAGPLAATAGATGGATGETAASFAPEAFQPAVNAAGNILGGLGVSGAAAGARAVGAYAQPITAPLGRIIGLGGKPNELADLAGVRLLDSTGQPIMVTPGQAALAGRAIEGAASDPAAVRAALDTPATPLVPGSQPTTFQVTRDPQLGQVERGFAKDGSSGSVAFNGRADVQNDARVAAVRGIAPDGVVGALPQELQAQAQAFETAGQQAIADTRQAASAAPQEAAETATVAGLQGRATAAAQAMGGDLPAGAEGQVGAALRAPLDAANQAARVRERALWQAVDPDGSLGVDMRGVRAGAQQIAGSRGANAKPPSGEEAAILQTAAQVPDTQSFRDLADLRGRITDELRVANASPEGAQASRRLSILLGDVHDAMEGAVHTRAAREASAVNAGTMNVDDAMVARLNAWAEEQRGQQAAAAVGAGYGGSQGVGPVARGGTQADAGLLGTAGQAGERFGGTAGAAGVSGQAPALTPNFDAAAQARYADARSATAARAATFKNAPGVGEALAPGPTSGTFRAPDSTLPNVIVRVGPEGADVARAYVAAGGTTQGLSDAAAFSLRQAAMRDDGTLDPGRYASWARQRASFLSQIPDAAARFGEAAGASQALREGTAASTARLTAATKAAEATANDAIAAHAQATKAMQASAIGRFLGDADPVQTVGKLLRSPTAQADMTRLADATASNPAARAGLQRAVADSILRDLQSDQGTVTGTESTMRSADFQRFIRQSEPALRAVLDDKQVAALKAVADDLHRSGLSVSGTRVAGGSDTAQNTGAVSLAASLGRSGASELGTSIRSIGPGAGAAAGFYVGGPGGAALGAVLGAGPMAAKAMAAARAAGLKTVNDLVREAMLNPQLAQVLLARVTPKNQANVAGALAAALNRANAAADGDQRRRQQRAAPAPQQVRPQAAVYQQVNPLAMMAPPPGPVPPNSLSGLMGLG